MSERKVLNKYYPPDFDPTKIPKLKAGRNKQFSIRIMSPFNMRCNTCGGYIYKGKKFNSRKETVEDETYLGLYIFRFYIKCPMCVAEIAFKTDPENTDYTLEAGATRNFEALRTAELLAEKELKEKEEEEASNPMKVLENRTKASRQEMDMIETLEDLKEMNSRHAKMDHAQVIKLHQAYEEQLKRLQDEEDEELVRSLFGADGTGYVKRLPDPEDAEQTEEVPKKIARMEKPTDFLTKDAPAQKSANNKPGGYIHVSTAGKSSRAALSMLVKRKQPTKPPVKDSDSKEPVKETGVTTTKKDSADKTTKEVRETMTGNVIVEKTEQQKPEQKDSESKPAEPKPSGSTGLSMLGDYSDSSEGDSSN